MAIKVKTIDTGKGDGADVFVKGLVDGSISMADFALAMALKGRVFVANAGIDTTPATFAGAYDADAPDLYIYIPSNTTIIPIYICVKYEAVGTESEMEVQALASNNGDSSATGTALTIKKNRPKGTVSSNCTATSAVDAAGITDPHLSGSEFHEFWRRGHPLKDTSATGENDRHEQVYEWPFGALLAPPVIEGEGSLSVYAPGQASTGFIIARWIEFPSAWLP